MIRAYLLNYEAILKPVFEGDLLPFPILDPGGFGRPPQCGIHVLAAYDVPAGANTMRWIHPSYLLVHGSAYLRDGSVTLVMLDWAHDCLNTQLCPPLREAAEVDEYRWVKTPPECSIRTLVYRAIHPSNTAPFEGRQIVHLDLIATALRLDPRARYFLRLSVLDPLGGTPRPEMIHEVIGPELGSPIIKPSVRNRTSRMRTGHGAPGRRRARLWRVAVGSSDGAARLSSGVPGP